MSLRERQILYVSTHMWNLRNKMNEQLKTRERERQTKKQNLYYREHIDGHHRGGVGQGEGGETSDGD